MFSRDSGEDSREFPPLSPAEKSEAGENAGENGGENGVIGPKAGMPAPGGELMPGKAPGKPPGVEPGLAPIIEFMRLESIVESAASSFLGAGKIH